jgi:hypothetical protein
MYLSTGLQSVNPEESDLLPAAGAVINNLYLPGITKYSA